MAAPGALLRCLQSKQRATSSTAPWARRPVRHVGTMSDDFSWSVHLSECELAGRKERKASFLELINSLASRFLGVSASPSNPVNRRKKAIQALVIEPCLIRWVWTLSSKQWACNYISRISLVQIKSSAADTDARQTDARRPFSGWQTIARCLPDNHPIRHIDKIDEQIRCSSDLIVLECSHLWRHRVRLHNS